MSFSSEAKREIIENASGEPCCQHSLLYGILCFAAKFDKSGIVIKTNHDFVGNFLCAIFGELNISFEKISLSSGERFEVFERNSLEKLMGYFGYSGEEYSLRIKNENFMCERCMHAFIGGAFVCAGSVTDPKKGYHLEFKTHRANLCGDFVRILAQQGFPPKLTARSSNRIIYYKVSSQIEDILTYMGASPSSLELIGQQIYKDIRNNVNRKSNCEDYNLTKTINASYKDIEAINYIIKRRGMSYLPEELREVACLRRENPDMSLKDIAAAVENGITRSGIMHRMKRIREIAEELKRSAENGR